MAAPFHVPLILIILYSVLVVALMVVVIIIRQPELMLLIMLPSVAGLFYLISHYLHEKSLANRGKSNGESQR